jgi:hypothetical protein
MMAAACGYGPGGHFRARNSLPEKLS